MSASLVADIEGLTWVLPCCGHRGSYMSTPLVADIVDLTCVLFLLQI